MPRYALLPDHIRQAMHSIAPSDGGSIMYYPCRVILKNGASLHTVYIEPEKPYLRVWGIYPEDDRDKRSVCIEDVIKVEDSPVRLPFQFANEIYRNGESGMGYTIFTVVFSDGRRHAYSTETPWISYGIQKEKGLRTWWRSSPTKGGMRTRRQRRGGTGAFILRKTSECFLSRP
jgi:hypothetical protein